MSTRGKMWAVMWVACGIIWTGVAYAIWDAGIGDVMIIGFVIVIVSALPAPVSERIYPTIEACEHIKARLNERRPLVQLECAEVRR